MSAILLGKSVDSAKLDSFLLYVVLSQLVQFNK